LGDSETKGPIVSDYPYKEQQVITGTLTYEGETIVEGLPPSTVTYEFSYRVESGLVRLSGVENSPQAQSVIGDTNRVVDGPPLTQVPFSRLGLWSFIFAGDRQTGIKIIDIENNEYVDFEEFEDLSRKEIADEHNAHAASIDFTSRADIPDVYVRYSNGKLSFGSDTTERGREYVLQMYEKYVVEGQILPELLTSNEENAESGDNE
jgi:hypothetical protein